MSSNSAGITDTADRELIVEKLLDAPIELVWEAWTNPELIKNWWGPEGFKNTIHKMELKPDGEWQLVMHGPDGKDYKNRSVFKEIIKHKRIVFDHVSGPKYMATITFTPQGNKTHLQWQMVFQTAEQFEQVVKVFKADVGLRQNVIKLAQYLATLSSNK